MTHQAPTRAAAASERTAGHIDLSTPLTMRTAFRFPLQHALSRREVMIGGTLLLLPGIGWLLNMGHRIRLTHNMQHGRPAWPAWRDYPELLKHGAITFGGMIEYHLPSVVVGYLADRYDSSLLWALSVALWATATAAVPGYMSHYCRRFDASEIYNPFKALRRVAQGGRAYWHAWGIALTALLLSFTGLLALGIGFLYTSVWFWQVAGYSFATVFTQTFGLADADTNRTPSPGLP